MFEPKLIETFQLRKTPFYFYDVGLLRKTLDSLKLAAEKRGYQMHYAIKANSNPEILRMISSYGFGADCVSGNEIKAALDNGFPASKIAFAGVGKTDEEINIALESGIFSINCESWPELEVINHLSLQKGLQSRVALRLNPNLDPHTHHYITTGLEENKFGISLWELDEILEKLKGLKGLRVIGLHFHLGSQITDLSVFKTLCIKVNEIQRKLERYHGWLGHLNLGGGLGINYHDPDQEPVPDFEKYFSIISEYLEPLPGQIVHFEPGRAIVAQCGTLISKVLYVKKGINTNFAILDAGMTELLRPALYQAYHRIECLTPALPGTYRNYDVVGPICESSDCFGKSIELPEIRRGDLIAIRSAGAYGEVMSSNYNLREKVKAYYSERV